MSSIDDRGVSIPLEKGYDLVFERGPKLPAPPVFQPGGDLWYTCARTMRGLEFVEEPADGVIVPIAKRYGVLPVQIKSFWKQVYRLLRAALAISPAECVSLDDYKAKLKGLSGSITDQMVDDFITHRLKPHTLTLKSPWDEVVTAFKNENDEI